MQVYLCKSFIKVLPFSDWWNKNKRAIFLTDSA